MKNIPFEVVVIYESNNPYEPYTREPPDDSYYDEVYALKIGSEYFTLGVAGDGVHISDMEDDE